MSSVVECLVSKNKVISLVLTSGKEKKKEEEEKEEEKKEIEEEKNMTRFGHIKG